MNTVPQQQQPDEAEALRLALLDGAPADLTAAAVTLLTDIPGALYTDPALARYITHERKGDVWVAIVNWPQLGVDLLAGAMLHLPGNHRALLLIAASIGGGAAVPIRLGPVLLECKDDVNLIVGAFQHAGGIW